MKTRLDRTLAKLGLGTRVELVVLAHESGLISPGTRDMTTT